MMALLLNSSWAVTVAGEGLRRFNAVHPLDLPGHQAERDHQAQFVALLLRYRQQLQALYDTRQDDAAKRAGKQRIYAALRQDYAQLKQGWGGYAGFDPWMSRLNNASLNGVATYYDEVPALQHLLAAKGNSLPAFYAACRALAHLTPEQRRAALAAAS